MSHLGNRKFDALGQYVRYGCNLLCRCSEFCRHQGVLEARKVHHYFFIRRWNDKYPFFLQHIRCSICRSLARVVLPTNDPPTIDWGPRSDEEWKALIRRLRD